MKQIYSIEIVLLLNITNVRVYRYPKSPNSRFVSERLFIRFPVISGVINQCTRRYHNV